MFYRTQELKNEIQNLERTVESKFAKQKDIYNRLVLEVERIQERLEQRDTNWNEGYELESLRDHINRKIADGTYEDQEKELVTWLFEELKDLRLAVDQKNQTEREEGCTNYTDRFVMKLRNSSMKSTCCKAPVYSAGKGDFHKQDRAITMHYECTQCNRACDVE